MDKTNLRPARNSDAASLARLFTLSRRLLQFVPDVHSEEDDRAFVESVVLKDNDVTVATYDDDVVGFIARGDGWIDHLYVHPDHIRHGIGSRLLQYVMQAEDGLRLWTFQRNTTARAFYEHHGFYPARFTDGRENMEKEPDVLYVWTRPMPCELTTQSRRNPSLAISRSRV